MAIRLHCVLLAFTAHSTRSVPAATHVKYLSFYDYDAVAQFSFCSIGFYTHVQGNTLAANSSLLAAWQRYRFPSVLDVEGLGSGFNNGLTHEVASTGHTSTRSGKA